MTPPPRHPLGGRSWTPGRGRGRCGRAPPTPRPPRRGHPISAFPDDGTDVRLCPCACTTPPPAGPVSPRLPGRWGRARAWWARPRASSSAASGGAVCPPSPQAMGCGRGGRGRTTPPSAAPFAAPSPRLDGGRATGQRRAHGPRRWRHPGDFGAGPGSHGGHARWIVGSRAGRRMLRCCARHHQRRRRPPRGTEAAAGRVRGCPADAGRPTAAARRRCHGRGELVAPPALLSKSAALRQARRRAARRLSLSPGSADPPLATAAQTAPPSYILTHCGDRRSETE